VKQVQSAIPIAVVMTSFEPGGTERQMTELVRRLDPARWEVHLACFEAKGPWFERAAGHAASVTEFPVSSFMRPGIAGHISDFARWCRRRRIAVVQATEIYSNIFALPAALLARVPARIGSRRGINSDRTRGLVALQRLAFACATKVVANSRASADQLRLEHVPRRKVSLVANGLDLERYAPRSPRGTLRKVTVVANLRQLKGHDVLVDASVEILTRVPDARFELIGDGPERAALAARAAARGVAHAFTFVGHCDDVPARLAETDIFVLPSRSESFPNAILEAMAAGLPIVASGVGGILELIEDGRTGSLVPPGDAGALAGRVLQLMADPAKGTRFGAAARADALARFSFDRMVAGFDAIYLTELARRGMAPASHSQLAVS
jgi:glycosyltransferase involved in cell wall biosynthesis